MNDQYCMICLKESVKGEIDKLKLCMDCFNNIKGSWDEKQVNKY